MFEPNPPYAKRHHSRGNIPKPGHPQDDPQGERRLERLVGFKGLQDTLLHHGLKSLDDTCDPLSSTLHLGEIVLLNTAGAEWFGKNICIFHRITDRAIDAHSADRQHHMRRIANQQKSGTVPAAQAARFNREHIYLMQVTQQFDPVSQPVHGSIDRSLQRAHSFALYFVVGAAWNNVSYLPLL